MSRLSSQESKVALVKKKIIAIRLTILASIGFAIWLCFATWWLRPSRACVQLSFPHQYSIDVPTIESGEGLAILYLEDGNHIIRFTKDGKQFACVVNVQGGGEIYDGISEREISPIVMLREAR